ncbi:MAG: hypothetical protein A3J40_02405 [Erythrobacter sp. RIFCSPHIGHO2_12_FULL_63_10]|nr:MAG: hypothetical protein A3J40_02405 [Erythrobacter sp. RIFCSPHIGHO2_12_FULL_63_10]
MTLSAIILPLLLQVGPDPTAGAIPDYSAEIQDRPPREAQAIEPPASWLSDCFELIDSDPARAHVLAQMRRDGTTDEERILANHCLGLAATTLERWDEAMAAFLAARDEVPLDDPRMRARLGAMAANAALATGDARRALALLDTAIGDARASASADITAFALIDRGRTLVALGDLAAAETALAEARELRPDDGEARLLSATLLRRMGRLAEAQQQIEQAARVAPNDLQVGLEAGVIAALDGRDEAARESWQSVLAIAPDSGEAESARAYIQQLGPAPKAP